MTANSGLAFHCYHDSLFDWVYDYAGRVEYIKREKPAEEQELRLRLFKMIPPDKIHYKAGTEARAEYVKGLNLVAMVDLVAMKKLHKELCPDCPWDGKTIFVEKG